MCAFDVGSLEIEIIISVSHAQLERKLFSLLTHLDYTHAETHVRYPSGFSPPPPLSGSGDMRVQDTASREHTHSVLLLTVYVFKV